MNGGGLGSRGELDGEAPGAVMARNGKVERAGPKKREERNVIGDSGKEWKGVPRLVESIREAMDVQAYSVAPLS